MFVSLSVYTFLFCTISDQQLTCNGKNVFARAHKTKCVDNDVYSMSDNDAIVSYVNF